MTEFHSFSDGSSAMSVHFYQFGWNVLCMCTIYGLTGMWHQNNDQPGILTYATLWYAAGILYLLRQSQWVTHHWFRKWLVDWPAPRYCLNQWWNIVNSNLRNKLQWTLKQHSNIFIQENAFEYVIWKMAAILSRPQCVNQLKICQYS